LIVGDRSKTGRTAQVAERGRSTALSTHTCLSRFSCPLTGVLCKRPFIEIVEKIRIRLTRPWADFCRRVSKIATDRPLSKVRRCANDPSLPFATDRFGEG